MLITSVGANFNSTTLAAALCRAGGRDWATLTEAERYQAIDVCQFAIDYLVAQKILNVESPHV